MIRLTLGEIAGAIDGWVSSADADIEVSSRVSVDSRQAVVGGLFVAVPGERVDGHEFAAAAGAAGAAAAIGSRPTELPTVVVADPRVALGRLAHYVVSGLPEVVTIAITGSQGKTGTKDYLAAILTSLGPCVATRGNYNNEIGVPLTMLEADQRTKFLVVEMGARHRGNIAYLCDLARPRIAAAINVGHAHLGEFGSQDAIAATKGEIVERLPPEGYAVLNADDPLTMAMAGRTPARVLTFGAAGEVSARGVNSDDFGRTTFDLGYQDVWHPVQLAAIGGYQVANACAAAAMAIAAGASLDLVARALTNCRLPSRWRMELHERADGLAVINDAYNASPAAMAAAIDTLAGIGRRSGRRTVAVLGEMRELGADAERFHRAVGHQIATSGIGVLVTVGERAGAIVDAASSDPHWPGIGVAAAGRDDAIAWLGQNVSATDVVLVKASRGAALEHIADALSAAALPSSLGAETMTDHPPQQKRDQL
ncbi:MAG: UDP-N-acetylmuramoyl-tripeptide--D-alanyl-D-alanine ligase [Nocardioides sp.]